MEEFRNTADVLGQSRNLGQGSSARPFDMVYGKPSASNRKSKSQLSAAEIIRGRYNYEEQKPDRDLGKSITPGFRNISLEVSWRIRIYHDISSINSHVSIQIYIYIFFKNFLLIF